jgi:hypothetical protein
VVLVQRDGSDVSEDVVAAMAEQLPPLLGLAVAPAPAKGTGARPSNPTAATAAATATTATPLLVVLTWGEVGGPGGFVVVGDPARLAVVGPAVAAAVEGRGGLGRGAFQYHYQGKAKRMADADTLRRAVLAPPPL